MSRYQFMKYHGYSEDQIQSAFESYTPTLFDSGADLFQIHDTFYGGSAPDDQKILETVRDNLKAVYAKQDAEKETKPPESLMELFWNGLTRESVPGMVARGQAPEKDKERDFLSTLSQSLGQMLGDAPLAASAGAVTALLTPHLSVPAAAAATMAAAFGAVGT